MAVPGRGRFKEEGFEPKPSYVLEDDPNQVGVGIFESGILALSTQEQLDIIDRDLSKID